MSRFLLDTDTISHAQFGHPVVIAHLASRRADVLLPVIAFQEQIRGWLGRLAKLRAPRQQADWYDRLVNNLFPIWREFPLVSFAEPAILRFDQLRRLRLNVGMMDLRIAAVALENGCVVVARNTSDFSRVPGLSLADWTI